VNIFKSFTLKWWQAGLIKISMIALGIVIGATWSEALYEWRIVLLLLFIFPSLYFASFWLNRDDLIVKRTAQSNLRKSFTP